MISVIQNNDLYEIRFKYDPEIIQIIKTVNGRQWNPERKFWTIPVDRLGFMLNAFKGTKFEPTIQIQSAENLGKNEEIPITRSIPNIDLRGIKLYVEDGKKLFDHQKDSLRYAINRYRLGLNSGFVLADQPGLGKAVTLDTPIPTPSGDRLMKDIDVGDYVFDETGAKTRVTAVYNHDKLKMYRVTFDDNTSVICCEDHLWEFAKGVDGWKVWPLKKIISGSNYGPKSSLESRLRDYRIPRSSCVQFDSQPVPIDGYLLGALLGDGGLTTDSITFTSSYKNILSEICKYLPQDVELVQDSKSPIEYRISSIYRGRSRVKCLETNKVWNSVSECKSEMKIDITYVLNKCDGFSFKLNKHFVKLNDASNSLIRVLRNLGLANHSAAKKFIPKIYLYNSSEVRWSLLQGLMDTDGYANKENGHSYSTISKQLANDVAYLVRSLGGIAVVHELTTKFNGQPYKYWEVLIRVDDPRMLYRASDKLNRASIRKFLPRKKFKSIEFYGYEKGKCITVDSPSHLYICGDFIVTHNTVSAANIALYRKSHDKFKHCLIICCINTSKYNWYDDIMKHTNGQFEPYILGSRKNRKGQIVYKDSKEKLEDLTSFKKFGKNGDPLPYFLIMNIEAIRYKEGRNYPIAERIAELCNSGTINMIVIDEIHKNCSPTSQQGKQLLKIKKATKSKVEWLPMTGTPITTSPLNCFLPFRLIDAHDRDSFYLWSQHYCVYGGFGGHEIIGYKNMPELKLIVQQNMLRRLKKDALDLPDKIHITEYVDNTPYQNSLYRQVRGEIAAQRGVITASMNPLAQFMRLRQVNGYPEVIDSNLKLDGTYLSKNSRMRRCLEIIEDHIANNEKVIVFSNWVEPLRTLYRFASKKWKTCVYTGTMKAEEREKHKYAFQNDPQYKLMLGTIGALGTSHTLTASHVVIFYDDCWNPTDKEQAEDRANRIGSTESEIIYTLISRGTIDERVQQILYTKDGIAKFIVDDDLDLKKNPELFDLLLGQDL